MGNNFGTRNRESTITYRFSVPVTLVTIDQNWWNGEWGTDIGSRNQNQVQLLLSILGSGYFRPEPVKSRTGNDPPLLNSSSDNNTTPQQVRFSNFVLI